MFHTYLAGPSAILYECNWRCRCHKQRCGNRVIQKGIKVSLELFKHKDMGWGVRARQAIPRGTFVCEYVIKSCNNKVVHFFNVIYFKVCW